MTTSNKKDIVENTFRKYLFQLYKQIDKSSSLLWNHDNHITSGKKLRSNEKIEEDWFQMETTQIGYGEIGLSPMTSLFNLMQNADILIERLIEDGVLKRENLLYSPKEYTINKNSYFLDIGSGFGKPCYHAAFQVGCESMGIEVVPARVEFCSDFYYEFLDGKNFFKIGAKTKNNSEFFECNKENINNINNSELFQQNYHSDKIINKKITDEFVVFNNKGFNWIDTSLLKNYEFSMDFFKSYFFDSEFNANFLNPLYHKYIQDKLEDINRNAIVYPYENMLKFNWKFNFITSMTVKINQKLNTNVAYALTNNINYAENNSYISLPKIEDLPNNIFYLNYLEYFNNFLTQITPNKNKIVKYELLSELKAKENLYSIEEYKDLVYKVMNRFTYAGFQEEFYKKVRFIADDATKYDNYSDPDKKIHYTHIYSYNKLMSDECRGKISKILNRTNWRILCWYSNEILTEKAGLKNYCLIAKFQMCSTSTEKFCCYVFIKTKK